MMGYGNAGLIQNIGKDEYQHDKDDKKEKRMGQQISDPLDFEYQFFKTGFRWFFIRRHLPLIYHTLQGRSIAKTGPSFFVSDPAVFFKSHPHFR